MPYREPQPPHGDHHEPDVCKRGVPFQQVPSSKDKKPVMGGFRRKTAYQWQLLGPGIGQVAGHVLETGQ